MAPATIRRWTSQLRREAMADGAATQLEKMSCLVIAVDSTDLYGPPSK